MWTTGKLPCDILVKIIVTDQSMLIRRNIAQPAHHSGLSTNMQPLSTTEVSNVFVIILGRRYSVQHYDATKRYHHLSTCFGS